MNYRFLKLYTVLWQGGANLLITVKLLNLVLNPLYFTIVNIVEENSALSTNKVRKPRTDVICTTHRIYT
jgi:hypothetical protein